MVLITTFSSGLKEGEFIFSVLKNEPKTMANMLFKATKYTNVEDTLISRKDKKGKRKRESIEDIQPDTREKTSRYNGKRVDRKARPPSGWIINFTPLNTPLDQGLMQIKDNSTLDWVEKLKGDLNKRSKEKYCHFDCDNGHNTSKCYELKSQIEALIWKGKLQQFVKSGPGIQPLQGLEQLSKAEEQARAPFGGIRMIIKGSPRLMEVRHRAPLEDRRCMVEPMEELEDVSLDDNHPTRDTRWVEATSPLELQTLYSQ